MSRLYTHEDMRTSYRMGFAEIRDGTRGPTDFEIDQQIFSLGLPQDSPRARYEKKGRFRS